MKKMIAVVGCLCCVITAAVRAQTDQTSFQVVYPPGCETVTLDTNFTIGIVVQSPNPTNLMISLDYEFPGEGYYEMTLLVTNVPAGLSTNVCKLPDYDFDYADQRFFVTIYAGDDGISFSYETQSGWFDIIAPPVPNVVTLSADEVMRPGRTNCVSCQWTNVQAGQPYQVFLDWADTTMLFSGGYDVGTPANGPTKIMIASGVFPSQNGMTNIQVSLPKGIQPGLYGVTVIDTAYATDTFDINVGGPNDNAYTHVGLASVPTQPKIDNLYYSNFSWNGMSGLTTLLMEGVPNTGYYVQESTNLVDWITLAPDKGPVSSPSGSFYMSDNFNGQGNSFYRMKIAPPVIVTSD